MAKCMKCGTNFVGTPEQPPFAGWCKYCEIEILKVENLQLANERYDLEKKVSNLKASIHVAHGLLVSWGGETSKDSIEAATSILRKAL